jgi:riboflavin kinase/FMN adenylyltransferase
MRHIHDLADAHLARPALLAIGVFDGVHRGHQYLLAQLVATARATGRTPAVLTFHPNPRMVIGGWEPGYYLTLPDEKAALLGSYGIELVITHPFDEHVRTMRAREFVTRLKEHLDLGGLRVGPDFALGYRREGDVPFLRALGAELGFAVQVVDEKLSLGGEAISSGRVRRALADGDVSLAAELLGRPYALSGQVVRGDQRGRTIGVPTANLLVSPDRAVPARGVYATRASVGGATYPAVTNIGVRPTFNHQSTTTIEAHLLDFAGDLYDQALSLDFVAHLRDERRFGGIGELVEQIQRDIAAGRVILTAEGAEHAE